MSDFVKKLVGYKNDKIALYGLGTETERVLKELDSEFEIIGLLDGFRKEGELYEKPIISLEQAVESNVKLILVVARPGSCKAIARRIGEVCRKEQIDLIDIRGKNLCTEKKAVYHLKDADGITKDGLRQFVDAYDVISIDLFDTLIMRQTMFSSDVFEITDFRLREKDIYIENFYGKRLASEKSLSQNFSPTLTEIYSYMIDAYDVQNACMEDLAELESSIDYDLVVPRLEICELLSELYSQGKEVYIVSDTYYTRNRVEKILKKCGIHFYTDILASCEYKTGKTGTLFKILKERTLGKRCIHIGDDLVADIESAEKNGIAAYRIYSGVELLEMAGYLGMWDCAGDLSDRIRIGMFVSLIFNSPFQFETEACEICIKSAYDIGYLLFAPIISDFVLWFDTQVKNYCLRNVWFCARDGYLIKRLYDALNRETKSVYFLTSRTAAIRAGVENEEDIAYVGEMKFSGTLQEQMRERFGIMVPDERADGVLLDYKDEIVSKALKNRKNYRRYIDHLDIKKGDIAFFDFVAKGTSQMYIGRLVANHLKGLYFLQLEEDHMKRKGLDILPFYNNEEMNQSAIFDNYYILETMLTSPESSVQGFGEDGEAYYAEETRKEEDIICFLSAQDGIFDYFKTYLAICPGNAVKVNKKLDEIMLSLVHGISILDKAFLNLKVEDPFFNRTTDIMDLI